MKDNTERKLEGNASNLDASLETSIKNCVDRFAELGLEKEKKEHNAKYNFENEFHNLMNKFKGIVVDFEDRITKLEKKMKQLKDSVEKLSD